MSMQGRKDFTQKMLYLVYSDNCIVLCCVSSPFLVHIKSKLFSFVLLLESMGRSVAKA